MVTLSGQRGGQPRISYGQLMSSLEVALIEPVRNIDLYGCVEQLASLAMRIRRSEFRWPHVGQGDSKITNGSRAVTMRYRTSRAA